MKGLRSRLRKKRMCAPQSWSDSAGCASRVFATFAPIREAGLQRATEADALVQWLARLSLRTCKKLLNRSRNQLAQKPPKHLSPDTKVTYLTDLLRTHGALRLKLLRAIPVNKILYKLQSS